MPRMSRGPPAEFGPRGSQFEAPPPPPTFVPQSSFFGILALTPETPFKKLIRKTRII